MFSDLNKIYADEYSGWKNPAFLQDSLSANLIFLAEHSFVYRQIKFEKDSVFALDIPMKAEPLLVFCRWLIKKFLKSIELMHVSGSTLFQSLPAEYPERTAGISNGMKLSLIIAPEPKVNI